MQGQAFLVTFAAIGKSDWPRAAIERADGKELSSLHQTLRQAQGECRGHLFLGYVLLSKLKEVTAERHERIAG